MADKSSSKKTERWKRRRLEIINHAEHLFAQKGFNATRLEEIAERTGVRRESLIYYFKSKEELYDATLGEIYTSILKVLGDTLDASQQGRQVEDLTSAWIDYLVERPAAGRVLLREVIDRMATSEFESVGILNRLLVRLLGAFQGMLPVAGAKASFTPSDVIRFSLSIAGNSLFWVSSREIAEELWFFDPLDQANIDSHKNMIVEMTRGFMNQLGQDQEQAKSA